MSLTRQQERKAAQDRARIITIQGVGSIKVWNYAAAKLKKPRKRMNMYEPKMRDRAWVT